MVDDDRHVVGGGAVAAEVAVMLDCGVFAAGAEVAARAADDGERVMLIVVDRGDAGSDECGVSEMNVWVSWARAALGILAFGDFLLAADIAARPGQGSIADDFVMGMSPSTLGLASLLEHIDVRQGDLFAPVNGETFEPTVRRRPGHHASIPLDRARGRRILSRTRDRSSGLPERRRLLPVPGELDLCARRALVGPGGLVVRGEWV